VYPYLINITSTISCYLCYMFTLRMISVFVQYCKYHLFIVLLVQHKMYIFQFKYYQLIILYDHQLNVYLNWIHIASINRQLFRVLYNYHQLIIYVL